MTSTTCDIIYESHRRKKLEKTSLNLILVILTCLLAVGVILVVSFVNYDQWFALRHDRIKYLNNEIQPCSRITYGMIDLISTPIAFALLIFYVILCVCLRGREYGSDRIAFPMITTSWTKSNRFHTACIYGLMAHNIYEIVLSAFNDGESLSQADIDLNNVHDPTGIVKLLFTLAQVILVGISE
jgi:hypothetical protein